MFSGKSGQSLSNKFKRIRVGKFQSSSIYFLDAELQNKIRRSVILNKVRFKNTWLG